MDKRFPGRIALEGDEEVDVDLQLSASMLRLESGASAIGSWPLSVCQVTELGDDLFELHVEDDAVGFAPEDPEGFRKAVDEVFRPASLISRLRQVAEEEPPATNGESAGDTSDDAPDPWFVAGSNPPAAPIEPDPGLLVPLELPPPIGSSDDPVSALNEAVTEPSPDGSELPTVDGLWVEEPAVAEGGWTSPAPDPESTHEDSGAETPADTEGDEPEGEEPGAAPAEDEYFMDADASSEPLRDSEETGTPDGRTSPIPDEEDESEIEVLGRRDGSDREVASFGTVSGLRERPSFGLPVDRSALAPVPEVTGSETAPPAAETEAVEPESVGSSPRRLASVTSLFGSRATEDADLADLDVFDPSEVMADAQAERPPPVESPDVSAPTGGPAPFLKRVSSSLGSLRRSARSETQPEETGVEEAGSVDEGPQAATETDERGADEPYSVADEILASQRELRASTYTKVVTPELIKRVALGAAAAVALVVLVWTVPKVIGMFTGDDDQAATATTATSPPTTVPAGSGEDPAPETTVLESPSVTAPIEAGTVLDLPANLFIERWNQVAEPVSPELVFRTGLLPGEFETAFTPYLSLRGVVESDGTVDWVTLVVDPTGPSEHDRLGIQTLGVVLAVADPALSGSERAATLAALGFDVSNPQLEGVSADLTRDGVRYALEYDSESVTLSLTLSSG